MEEEEKKEEDVVMGEVINGNYFRPKTHETFQQSFHGIKFTRHPDGSIERQEYSSPEEFVTASGTMIGGTISVLDALNVTIQDLEKRAFSTTKSDINTKLTQDLKPIQQELESTKKQIEETSNTLKTMESFIDTNKASFTNLISVEGKMNGIEGQLSSIQNRVGKLESEKNINWNKTTTIISLMIAMISACIAVASVGVAIYQYFK
jgi:hypothetical protein